MSDSMRGRGMVPGFHFWGRGISGIRCRGVTLIELLVALALSSIVIALSARIFLSGHFQFIGRMAESERLADLFRIKHAVQGSLRGEVTVCDGGKLRLRTLRQGGGTEDKELDVLLRGRFPNLDSLDFRCFEPDAEGAALVEWQGFAQPPLVEYRLVLGQGEDRDVLTGSWLK